jgi:hypothetical protein
MNKGIKMAKGSLIGMVNSDDWYENNAVELIVNAFIKNPDKTIFHGDRFDIDQIGNKALRKFHPSVFKFKYYGMTYNHPSMFVTPDEYLQHMYSTKLESLSDYQFTLETFLRDSNTLFYLDKPISNYRLDGISAKLTLKKSLIEGYRARKHAGLSLPKNLFSICVRFLAFYIKKAKNNES